VLSPKDAILTFKTGKNSEGKKMDKNDLTLFLIIVLFVSISVTTTMYSMGKKFEFCKTTNSNEPVPYDYSNNQFIIINSTIEMVDCCGIYGCCGNYTTGWCLN
jgi:hypothetical protein